MQNELNIVLQADDIVKTFKQRHYNRGNDSTRHSKLVSKICGDIGGMCHWLSGAFDRYVRHGNVSSDDAHLFSDTRIEGFTIELQEIQNEIVNGEPEYLENPSLLPDAKDALNAGYKLLEIIKNKNIGQTMRNAINKD